MPSRAEQVRESVPIVIGHRGACGYVPEHTLTSYFIAIQYGVDYIEPDLVMTKDGVLVARHENEIGTTTDVAARPEFAHRRTTKVIDGTAATGWFTEDFTLLELKTLRCRERIPDLRPGNARFDGQFQIPTLDEILALLAPTAVGVYPETKHPSYFANLGLAMEALLVRTLERYGYQGPQGRAFIQSFEVSNLKALRQLTQLPLVQLIESSGAPYDFLATGDPRRYADLIAPRGLDEIATYAAAIGPSKTLIIPRTSIDTLGKPTSLVADAHSRGIDVHAWTFRAENSFLPQNLRSSTDAAALGNLDSELSAYFKAGLDGFFTDHADIGVRSRDAFIAGR